MFELVQGGKKNGAKIKVVGVGGGGGNAVNMMITYKLNGVDFIAANTDAQALEVSRAPVKLQLGSDVTRGLGAGSDPDVGRRAATESKDRIRDLIDGADMVFITAGLGGGTGTGGAPVVAEVAREMDILTVAVVTKPFLFEGRRRELNAEEGLRELKEVVDSLIVIPNQRLLSISGRNMSLQEAFKKADDILYHGVKGISDLVMVPGLINLDFADVKAIMSDMGLALMGTGMASGEGRAIEAAQRAISSPLLEDNSIQGARGVLLNITGNADMTLFEVNEASTLVQSETHEDANIIFGTVIDENMGDELRVTVIATGFNNGGIQRRKETPAVASINTFKKEKEDLSTPAFIRNRGGGEKSPVVIKMGMISDDDSYDYDTPAFMRKTEN